MSKKQKLKQKNPAWVKCVIIKTENAFCRKVLWSDITKFDLYALYDKK